MLKQNRVVQILSERDQLPVKQFEEEIMAAIDHNPVVIIRGATGCGKTTQVPQYILDRFIKSGRASDCNIVVTQVTRGGSVGSRKELGSVLCEVNLILPPAQTDQRGLRGRAGRLRERRGSWEKLRLQRSL